MPEEKRELAFLSYAHADIALVRKVYAGLKKRKVNIWFDKEDLKPGKWKPQIIRAITHSKYFILCVSNTSLKKTSLKEKAFVDNELQTAWELAKEQDEKDFTIIPVRLEDCDRGDLRLSGWHQYDLFEDWEIALDKLAVDIKGVPLPQPQTQEEPTGAKKEIAEIMGEGEMFFYSKEYEKALSCYERASTTKSGDAYVWYKIGLTLLKLGRKDEAIQAYNKSIDLKPDDHLAWNNKGRALYRLSRYEPAIQAYRKAIEFKADFHEACYNKGLALSASGRRDEAIDAYKKAIEIKPDKHEAWLEIGKELSALGRKDESKKAFSKSVMLKQGTKK